MERRRDTFDIPITPEEGSIPDKITISGVWPITPAQWDHWMHVLEVMKPGLVREP